MKRTDLEKRERELRKKEKKDDILKRKSLSRDGAKSVGDYINELFMLFRYDEEEIFNTSNDIKILELLENMKVDLPEKQWENVLKKGIKKANINQNSRALSELKELLGI